MGGDAEGAEEVLIGKIDGSQAGRLVQDSGKDVEADRPVVELVRDSPPTAEKVQGTLRPVLAGADL